MRRAVIVIGATVVGLIGVLTFHTTPAKLTLGSLTTGTASRSTSTTTPAGASPPATGPSQSSPTAAAPATKPTTAPATTRSATGSSVDYHYGLISVTATVSRSNLTNVSIASLDDGGSPRSQSIDQQSIPMLEQQALQAQSANIQGVSGASYTSAGFQQSLQGALSQLGFK